MLHGEVELTVYVWSQGSPQQSLMHVQAALDAVRKKGRYATYERACVDKEEIVKNKKELRTSQQRKMRPFKHTQEWAGALPNKSGGEGN